LNPIDLQTDKIQAPLHPTSISSICENNSFQSFEIHTTNNFHPNERMLHIANKWKTITTTWRLEPD
jgi:hypothetical protein